MTQARQWALAQAEALRFLSTLPDGCVDAIITDPPYSSGGAFRGDRAQDTRTKYVQSGAKHGLASFGGDTRDQRSFVAWVAIWLAEAMRCARPGAPVAIWTDWRQLPATTDAMQAAGVTWRGIGHWHKGPSARPVMGGFRPECEYLVWGTCGAAEMRDEIGVLPGLVLAPPVPSARRLHQTEKPLEVMRWAVGLCPPGGTVLDPFAGSGSTGVAAIAEGRRFVGCELSPEYYDVASRRLAEAGGEMVDDGRQPTLWSPA